MRINIFHSPDLKVLADTINEWLTEHDHQIDIFKMTQCYSNDEHIITVLWRLREVF